MFFSVEEEIEAITNEAQNPSRTERLSIEKLTRLQNHCKNFHDKQVYSHTASSTDPWNETVRTSMVRDVKYLACKNLLRPNNGKFVGNDTQIYNLARDELTKNKSTKIPAVLLRDLGVLIKSIGRISCGEKSGTCWIVSGTLVITCHHVYRSFMEERSRYSNALPIEVSFDYFYAQQPERIHTIEVDEERDPEMENYRLDYKFLRLKENEALADRDSLGKFVRNRSLDDGLVIIVGHPKGKKMLEETCVVIRKFLRRTQAQRRHISVGPDLHMSNGNLLQLNEDENTSYDTTLFYGSSGSPVFDLSGNIIAMHTQGYTLDIGEGNEVSLMEFGVQFSAICEDMRGRNFSPEYYFPDCNLGPNEERMDEDTDQ